MKNGQGTGLRALIVLAAVLALMIGYYWVHKPLGLGLAQVWGGAALDLLTAGLILTVAGGMGRRLLTERLTMQQLSRAERIALEAGIGLGLLALVVLVMGMVGLLRPVALWVLMLAGAALNLWGMRGWLADVLHLARTLRPVTPWQRFLTLFCGVMLVTALLHALAPPTAWDALMYHLTGPQRYLAVAMIQPQPDNHYMGFPQGVEMLFTLAMGLFGRETAAAPLHFGYGLLALLAIGGLVRRYADDSAGLFGITLLLSSYSIWLLFGWPYVDLAVMAYALLVLVAVNQWRETAYNGWLVAAGVCLGLLVGVKYTGGLMAVAAAACVAFYAPRRAVRHVGLMAGVALLLFAPWMVRGLLLYENPVYPFLFDGLNWDATRTANFSQAYSGLLNSDSAWQLAVLPISATIFGLEKAPGYSFTLGPWLLTMPLLLLVGWRWLDDRARGLAVACLVVLGVLLLLWIPLAARSDVGMGPRQTAAAYVAVSAVAGGLGFYALSRWPRRPFDVYFIVRGIVMFTLVLALVEVSQATLRQQIPGYFFGQVSRERYLEGELGLYRGAMQRLAELPPGAEVRFLWESRTYYCPPHIQCTADVLTDAWARPIEQGLTSDAVFDRWRAEGTDYLLVWELGFEFSTYHEEHRRFADQNRLFPDARAGRLRVVWTDDFAYTLYTWAENAGR